MPTGLAVGCSTAPPSLLFPLTHASPDFPLLGLTSPTFWDGSLSASPQLILICLNVSSPDSTILILPAFICSYVKGRVIMRVQDLSSTGSLSKRLQWPGTPFAYLTWLAGAPCQCLTGSQIRSWMAIIPTGILMRDNDISNSNIAHYTVIPVSITFFALFLNGYISVYWLFVVLT